MCFIATNVNLYTYFVTKKMWMIIHVCVLCM